MTISDVGKKLGEWAALLAIVAVGGKLWINTEVERRMGELATNPADAPAVVTLTTKVDNLETGQTRIEGKVDTFSTEFLKYLERQANGG